MYLAGIEAGGTKFFTTISDTNGNVIERHRTDTTTPNETMSEVIKVLKDYQNKYDIKAIGLACFGPIDINPNSKTYGHITNTPKIAWQNFHIVSACKCSKSVNNYVAVLKISTILFTLQLVQVLVVGLFVITS